MLILLRLSISAILFCISIFAVGQEIRDYRIHLDDYFELPTKAYYGIIEDKNAIKWLATENGLYSYNGDTFELYRHKKQVNFSVFDLTLDAHGNVWYSNRAGQVFMTSYRQKPLLIISQDVKQQEFIPEISLIENQIYVLTQTEIKIFKSGDISPSHSITLPSYSSLVSGIHQINGRTLLFRKNSLFELKNNQLIKIASYDMPNTYIGRAFLLEINNKPVLQLREVQKNKYFDLSFSNELKEIDPFTESVEENFSFRKIEDNRIVFTSLNGVFFYEIDGAIPKLKRHIFKGIACTGYVKDSYGVEYISTLDDGLFLVPSEKIKELFIPNRADYRITNFEINRNDTLLYIINKKQIAQLHKGKLKTHSIKPFTEQFIHYNHHNNKTVLYNQGIYHINNKTGEPILKSPKLGVKDISFDQKYYYLGNYNSIEKYDLANDSSVIKKPGRTNFIQVINDAVLAFRADTLLLLDKMLNSKNTLNYKGNNLKPKSVVVGSDQRHLLLTQDNQVLQFQIADDFSTKIEALSDDFFNNHELKIIDATVLDTMLLVLTNRGIVKIDKISNHLFDIQGYINWERITEMKSSSDAVWISDGKRLLRLDIKIFEEEPSPRKKLEITSINDKSFSSADFMELPYDHDALLINTTIISQPFMKNGSTQYSINDEKNWITSNSGNQLVINNIPEGNNTIYIRSKNLISNEITATSSFSIRVLKPYWKKWWFLLSCLIGIVIFLYGLLLLRGKYLNRKFKQRLNKIEIENQLTQLKLENLRSQMNPHFIFNSLNSIQDYIHSNERAHAISYLVKFSRLIRMYLNHSRVSSITLKQELDTLKLYMDLEQERFDIPFEYSIELNKLLQQESILVPSLFLQPYVENSINHGLHNKRGEKRLTITFNVLNKEFLNCIITDTGIGRKASNELNEGNHHESFSMIANEDRIKLLNHHYSGKLDVQTTDLTDIHGNPIGTEVIIVLPIKYKYEGVNY